MELKKKILRKLEPKYLGSATILSQKLNNSGCTIQDNNLISGSKNCVKKEQGNNTLTTRT